MRFKVWQWADELVIHTLSLGLERLCFTCSEQLLSVTFSPCTYELHGYYISNTILKLCDLLAELMMDDPTHAPKSYEAGIFARLEGVKAAYDPNNLFRDLNYVHPNLEA